MLLTIYLSDEVANMLKYFGDIDNTINRILEAAAEGLIDIMDKPNIAEKKGGHYYKVNITEPNYISMLETFGTRSSRISLRRLLYWFVDNEVYSELGWEPTEEVVDPKINNKYIAICNLKQALFKAKMYLPEYTDALDSFKTFLNELEEEIWNV